MKNEHNLNCSAPICSGDPNHNYKNEVVWYLGESICKKIPYQKFQKIQIEINKSLKRGRFKKVDQALTANDLESSSI